MDNSDNKTFWRKSMMGHLRPSIKNLMVIVLLGGLVFVEGLGEVVFHNFKIN